jgi:peptidoglycan-N-acetylglucosamine deacetylase
MTRPLRSLALFALSFFTMSLAFAAAPLRSVGTDQPVVALTFDDGPHATHTTRLLELFARENIRVTFFEIGRNVAKHPELARAIVAAGHEIGNHTLTHANLAKLADIDAVRTELVEAQTIIRDAAGVTPVIFRAPFLAHGPELWTVLGELKLPPITADISTKDWDAAVTKEQIIESAAQAGPGSIVLMHTWPDKTVEALPEIISRLRAKGLRFVTISDLIALAPPAAE